MEYTKSAGAWLDADAVVDGSKVKIVTECVKQESKFTDKDGNPKTENVAQVRFQGAPAAVNMRLNWTTIYGLIDAFGKNSTGWIGQVLTAHSREALVGDTVRTVVYLVADGFELIKNAEKKLEIRRVGGALPPKPEVENETAEEINPDDIPF